MHACALPPATLRAVVFRFVALSLAIIVLPQALIWLSQALFGLPLPFLTTMNSILPVLVAAPLGVFWYGRERVLPSAASAWKIALLCAALMLLVEVALFFLSRWSGTQLGFFPPGGPAIAPWKAGIALTALQVVNVLATRFLFVIGARQAQRKAGTQG